MWHHGKCCFMCNMALIAELTRAQKFEQFLRMEKCQPLWIVDKWIFQGGPPKETANYTSKEGCFKGEQIKRWHIKETARRETLLVRRNRVGEAPWSLYSVILHGVEGQCIVWHWCGRACQLSKYRRFGMVEYVVVRFGWLSCDERPPGPQSSACVGIDSVPHCK